MIEPRHIPGREPCPFLPAAAEPIRPSSISEIRQQGGPQAYLAALTCAQSLWLQELPAQAILQLNHALSHPPKEQDPAWPAPYQALLWILSRRHEPGFLGNPVRHFQHLATRMSGPNQALRATRAWICFQLAESILPADTYPRDLRQIERENLTIPDTATILESLKQLTTPEESSLVTQLLNLKPPTPT